MGIHRGWTMKRIENVIRVRMYEERFHYEGDDAMTDSVIMASEHIIAIRDLPEFLVKHGITEFNSEEDWDILVSMF